LSKKDAVSIERLEEAEMLHRARAQDYRAAMFAKDIAQFELDMAKAALLHTRSDNADPYNPQDHSPLRILAPISGQVLRVFQESATVVPAGARLLELGVPSDLEVEVDVLSSDAVNIKPGTRALLEQWGGARPLNATVRRVEPSAFTKVSALGVEEQRVNVILDLKDPPQQRPTLGDGFRVDARIVMWEQENVLQVPTGALFRHRDWAVFVVQGVRAHQRKVKIDHRNSLSAEVTEGLREGDQVVLHPSDKVRDGVVVQLRDLSAE
jgi:HlyD family secretion protein